MSNASIARALAILGALRQASQFIDGRRGPLRIGRGVSHHQLEWSSCNSASVIDITHGQLEPGEQVVARLNPARPSEWSKSADLNG